MKVKISTNGKFHAITVLEPILAANMTAALHDLCEPFLLQEVKSVLFNLKDIQKMDSAAAEAILEIRNLFYANRASFVLCELQSE
jgi:anti-anti-sigma regulatory factor